MDLNHKTDIKSYRFSIFLATNSKVIPEVKIFFPWWNRDIVLLQSHSTKNVFLIYFEWFRIQTLFILFISFCFVYLFILFCSIFPLDFQYSVEYSKWFELNRNRIDLLIKGFPCKLWFFWKCRKIRINDIFALDWIVFHRASVSINLLWYKGNRCRLCYLYTFEMEFMNAMYE